MGALPISVTQSLGCRFGSSSPVKDSAELPGGGGPVLTPAALPRTSWGAQEVSARGLCPWKGGGDRLDQEPPSQRPGLCS